MTLRALTSRGFEASPKHSRAGELAGQLERLSGRSFVHRLLWRYRSRARPVAAGSSSSPVILPDNARVRAYRHRRDEHDDPGEAAVAVGTGLLAIFTWWLANGTYKLDKRTAARERKRQERRVRGVARLVDGELNVVEENFEHAFEVDRWEFGWTIPRGAWDSSGALIAETVAEDEALALTRLFAELGRWDTAMGGMAARHPDQQSVPIQRSPRIAERATTILAGVKDVRRDLRKLAYPDARDLEPDPDLTPPRRRFSLRGGT